MTSKPKRIKDFDNLSEELQEIIKLIYPKGFQKHLVAFRGIDGQQRKGLPLETEDAYYLIKMTTEKALKIVRDDDDYDDSGSLKSEVLDRLTNKYEDEDYLDEYNSNEDNDLGEEEALPITSDF